MFRSSPNSIEEDKDELKQREINMSRRTIQLSAGQYLSDELNESHLTGSKAISLIAGTGTGKTYACTRLYPDSKIILIVPTISLAKQVAKSIPEDVALLYSTQPWEDRRITVSTYDTFVAKIEKFPDLKNTLLVVDEADELYRAFHYRTKTMGALYNILLNTSFHKIIYMSATLRMSIMPNELPLDARIDVVKEVQDKHEITMYNCLTTLSGVLLDMIEKADGKVIVYTGKNSKNMQTDLQKVLNDKNIKCAVYNSNVASGKDTNVISQQCYDSIAEDGFIPSDVKVLICSPAIVSGVSIKNRNVDAVISYCLPSSDELTQFFARVREPKPDMKRIVLVGKDNKMDSKNRPYFDTIIKRNQGGWVHVANKLQQLSGQELTDEINRYNALDPEGSRVYVLNQLAQGEDLVALDTSKEMYEWHENCEKANLDYYNESLHRHGLKMVRSEESLTAVDIKFGTTKKSKIDQFKTLFPHKTIKPQILYGMIYNHVVNNKSKGSLIDDLKVIVDHYGMNDVNYEFVLEILNNKNWLKAIYEYEFNEELFIKKHDIYLKYLQENKEYSKLDIDELKDVMNNIYNNDFIINEKIPNTFSPIMNKCKDFVIWIETGKPRINGKQVRHYKVTSILTLLNVS